MKKIKSNPNKIIAWLIIIAVFGALYFLNPELFSIDFIGNFVEENKLLAMFLYFVFLSVLGLLMIIPSTPFAIAGVAIFSPAEAYILNLFGILTSTTIVYYFSRFLGIGVFFETRYPNKIQKLKKALKNKELPIIVGWSFFPAVPTDLITYVASGLRIPVSKCILGVLIGEGILNAFYIFSIGAIVNL